VSSSACQDWGLEIKFTQRNASARLPLQALHVWFMLALAVIALPAFAQKSGKSRMFDPVAFYFPGYDKNTDGKIDRAEWGRRGNFDLLDSNHDGGIDRSEFGVIYQNLGKGWTLTRPAPVESAPVMDPSLAQDMVDIDTLGKKSFCVVSRSSKCPDGEEFARARGLMPTGTGPIFPPGILCLGIDETFADAYEDKTGQGAHGGIDIPADYDTPLLAVASGTVVAKIENERQARGLTVVLRHSPDDTGLPFWTYTEYAHLKELPPQAIGQRVRMGEVIGLTGNTGIKPNSGKTISSRRPGLHFAVYYASGPRFAVFGNYAVPEDGHWMDPSALYRGRPPYGSQELLALPEQDKDIAVPFMLTGGTLQPQDTKLIWPYACRSLAGK